MKLSVFCSLVLFVNFSSYSQHRVSASVNSGIGKIETLFSLEEEQNAMIGSTVSDRYGITYGFDVNYSFEFGKLVLESGLNYNFIKGYQSDHFNQYKDFSGLYYDRMGVDVARKAHYLTLPLLVKYHQNKFSVGAGAFVSYLLTNSSMITFYKNDDFYGFQQGGNNMNKFDYGFRGMLGYDITEKVTLQFTTNIGFSNLNDGSEQGAIYATYQIDPISLKLRSKQFMLGVRYYFL